MTFNEYQAETKKTSIYPNVGRNFTYPAFGIASEAGEIADTLKRVVRDKKSVYGEADRELIKADIGDLLWYAAALASEFELRFDDVATYNLEKLAKRMREGTLTEKR